MSRTVLRWGDDGNVNADPLNIVPAPSVPLLLDRLQHQHLIPDRNRVRSAAHNRLSNVAMASIEIGQNTTVAQVAESSVKQNYELVGGKPYRGP